MPAAGPSGAREGEGTGSWDGAVPPSPQPPLAPEALLCLEEQTALVTGPFSAGEVKSGAWPACPAALARSPGATWRGPRR